MHSFILDPPHGVDFTLKNIFGIWVNATNSISVIEDKSLYISCSADSKPPVSKTEWIGLLPSDGSSLNITSIRRDQAGALICKVFNTMVSTDSNTTVTGSSSSVLQVDVLCKEAFIIRFKYTRIVIAEVYISSYYSHKD